MKHVLLLEEKQNLVKSCFTTINKDYLVEYSYLHLQGLWPAPWPSQPGQKQEIPYNSVYDGGINDLRYLSDIEWCFPVESSSTPNNDQHGCPHQLSEQAL